MTMIDTQFQGKGALLPFLKKIFGYSMTYRRWFVPFFIGVAIVAVIDAVFPLVWMNYIDGVITPLVEAYRLGGLSLAEEQAGYDGLYHYAWIYLGLMALQVGCVAVFIYYSGKIQEYVIYDLRKHLFNKLQKFSFSFYDRSAAGWLISRITTDTDRVTELISWGFLELIWGVIMMFACFSAMFIYSWELTLVVLVAIPVLMVVSIKLRLVILKYARESRKINSEMTAVFNEHVHGIEVNKISSQEDNAALRFADMSQSMRRASFRSAYYSAMYSPLVVMIGSIAAALVIYYGGHLALAGATGITLGVLAAFFGYARMIFEPIQDIARFYALAQSCLSAGERIFSLIDEEVDIVDSEGATDFNEISGQIEFRAVDFHYVPEKNILKGLNLSIRAGESIALVGPTGEGKSTIANLIGRFYEPTGGAIYIDGENYTAKTLASLRNQLGIILQTPHLFSGTILDNIRYANQLAGHNEVHQVLRSIGAEDLIERLHLEVGEEGGNLSIGEKQLVAFARVILKDPKILIMDEATSSVDTYAELRIQSGIEKLIRNRTSIIIAHRLSTIRHCDRILVIKGGEIIEEGNHQSLIGQRGFYYNLYTRQSTTKVA